MSGEAARHFGPYADEYRRFRPDYPPALFDRVAELAPRPGTAWECGAGSGQATAGLANRFERVVATDATLAQIAGAPGPARVHRVAALAEAAPLAAASADVVVAAQALHWFAAPPFFAEARRVARADGILVAWSYGLPSVGDAVDAVLARFHDDVLGAYWRPERRHVIRGYETLDVPFPPGPVETFTLEKRWSLERFAGYLGTWSAGREYEARHGVPALTRIEQDLAEAWSGGGGPAERAVRWPLVLRAWPLCPGRGGDTLERGRR